MDFSEYREPFVGGGSVFLALKQQFPNAKYWINDRNEELCCFWKNVRDHARDVLEEAMDLLNSYQNGRKLYNKLHTTDYKKNRVYQTG